MTKEIPEDWVPTGEGGWAAPADYEEPVKPRKPRPERKPDPDGEAWHAEHGKQWAAAVAQTPDDPWASFTAPKMPKWTKPKHVKRELLGRYIEDRDTGLVHDVQHATSDCAIDTIANGTFYHFESDLPHTVTDHTCMEPD